MFKKPAAGWLLVTFNTIMAAVTQVADDMYPVNTAPRFDAFNAPPRGARPYARCKQAFTPLSSIKTRLFRRTLFNLPVYFSRCSPGFSE
jgi:hypothetical protein